MLRFTIRDVLWLTVVVGLGCGWWIEHRRSTLWSSRSKAALHVISKRGITAHWYDNGMIVEERRAATDPRTATFFSGNANP